MGEPIGVISRQTAVGQRMPTCRCLSPFYCSVTGPFAVGKPSDATGDLANMLIQSCGHCLLVYNSRANLADQGPDWDLVRTDLFSPRIATQVLPP